MGRKQETASAVIDAAKVAALTINTYGRHSGEAASAVDAAGDARDRAYAAGNTNEDIWAADH